MAKDAIFRIVAIDPKELRRESSRLLGLVRSATRHGSVREVGSTAVPGLIGKGDIDFAVAVPAADFVEARADLDRAFVRDPMQLSTDAYQGYILPSKIDASIQLFVAGGEYDSFDRFIDLLQGDAQLRAAYNALKREWDGQPMDDYRAAKSAFIEAALASAD